MGGFSKKRNFLLGILFAVSVVRPGAADPLVCGRQLLRFHAGERFIYDSCGRVVLFRGANVPGYHTYPFPYNAQDIQALQSFGFNFVRLGISWQYAEPKEGQYDRAYLEAVVNFIREAGKAGIYVMPELHQIGWGAPEGGIPAWMCEKPPKSGSDLIQVAKESNRFWNQPELQDKMLGFWRYLIKNFSGLDNIFGYNVLNEPVSTDCLVYGAFEKKLFPFYERAIKVLREADPQMPVILEPCVFALILPTDTRPFPEPNLVYSPHPYFFHAYAGPPHGSSGAGRLIVLEREPPEELAAKYQRLLDEAKRMKAPLLIGEYGGPESRQFAGKWLEKSLALQDQYFLSSAIWAYDPSDQNWSVVDPERKPRPFYWNLLHRPYPRFTSGTPTLLYYSFSEKKFLYRFQPNQDIQAPTEIYLPKEFMKNPSLKISAPKWSYDEQEELLRIWNNGSEKEIIVELKF